MLSRLWWLTGLSLYRGQFRIVLQAIRRKMSAWLYSLSRMINGDVATRERCRVAAVGRTLKALRLDAGLTQAELAARLGTTQSAVARMEAGGKRTTLAAAERVAAALGCEMEVAFDRVQVA